MRWDYSEPNCPCSPTTCEPVCSRNADKRPLTIALPLIVSFMIGEVVVGILAHSLALISDAAPMLTDAGALLMSLIVIRLVQKPAEGDMTFGFKRAEILSAQA